MTQILPLLWLIGCAPEAFEFTDHTFTAEQEVLAPAFDDLLWPKPSIEFRSRTLLGRTRCWTVAS